MSSYCNIDDAMSRRRGVVAVLLRWVVGATFLFSGMVKSVDPVGTSIYINKYLATYALDALMPLSEIFAVALGVVEVCLGVLLICGVLRRFTAIVTLVVVALFTLVTLLSATLLPIGECGCFGDAVKLTPLQTLFKNIILLLLSVVVWRSSRVWEPLSPKAVVVVSLSLLLSLGVNLYALRHLPLVDFLPYKVGTPLYDAVAAERDAEVVVNILKFRDIATGDVVIRDASDVECWGDENLEFVEAATMVEGGGALYDEFRLYDAMGEECSLSILARKGRVALLCVNDAEAWSDAHRRGLTSLFSQYPVEGVVVLSCGEDSPLEDVVDITALEIYSVDAQMLRSLIRSDIGVVVLHDGCVEFKADIRDI